MKIFFRNIHLYLSLAAGPVIMSCCFTGAILVFEKELQELFHHDRYFVKKEALRQPLEVLVNTVKSQYPTAKIASVKIYSDAERSAEVSISIPGKERKEKSPAKDKETAGKKNKTSQEGGRPTHTVFVNPYSGKVIELYSYRETFFYTMFSLHRWLLGSDSSIGKTITGVSTIIFLFILVTGMILWWPKNKAILKQRLKIKTSASWKRVNHDLHLVLGFYSAIFLFIFAFTALAWSFKWFNDGIYTVTNTSMKPREAPHSTIQPVDKKIGYDAAFAAITSLVPSAQFYNIKAPADSVAVYTATILPRGVHETATDAYYIDQYSGTIIGSLKFSDKNTGQRIRSTFKPIHVGSIWGLPSKIVAFLVCVFGVTFPITGTIMWLNRLKKNKKKQPRSGDEEDDD